MNKFEVEALKVAVRTKSAWRGLGGLLLLKLPLLIFGVALVLAVATHQAQLGNVLVGVSKYLAR